jgi:hypothetical protein
MCAWSVTETLAEFSREVRGTVKPERMDEMAASRASGTEELLQVAHRDPRFGRDSGRREIGSGKRASIRPQMRANTFSL